MQFSIGNFNIDLRCQLNVRRNPWKEGSKIYRVPSAKANICETFYNFVIYCPSHTTQWCKDWVM